MYQLGDKVKVLHTGKCGIVTGVHPGDGYTVLLPSGSCQYYGYLLALAGASNPT